jgi:hypothetical protein
VSGLVASPCLSFRRQFTLPAMACSFMGLLSATSWHTDVVVGNTLIDMYRRVGLMRYAVRVFSCMQKQDFRSIRIKGLSVGGFTVSTVFSACSDMEDFTQGDQILSLRLKASFLSNYIVCSVVISFLCMSDRLPDAVWFFRGMTTWDSEPCNAMISGYARSGLMNC